MSKTINFQPASKRITLVTLLRDRNRINTFHLKGNYEIQRIDIQGEEDSLLKFKLKLRLGEAEIILFCSKINLAYLENACAISIDTWLPILGRHPRNPHS
jgi:hypothetical protein